MSSSESIIFLLTWLAAKKIWEWSILTILAFDLVKQVWTVEETYHCEWNKRLSAFLESKVPDLQCFGKKGRSRYLFRRNFKIPFRKI